MKRTRLEQRTPLERRTPLGSRSGKAAQLNSSDPIHRMAADLGGTPRSTYPGLKHRGAKSRRTEPVFRAACAVVDERSGGICEAPTCRTPGSDHHHVFGRTAALPWRWQNSAACIVLLCRPCHAAATTKPRLEWVEDMKWLAVGRMAVSTGLRPRVGIEWTATQSARDLVRRLPETTP